MLPSIVDHPATAESALLETKFLRKNDSEVQSKVVASDVRPPARKLGETSEIREMGGRRRSRHRRTASII